MRSLAFITTTGLIFASFCSLPLISDEIVYRSPTGALSTIEIESDHSFSEVISQIYSQVHMDEIALAKHEIQPMDEFLLDFQAYASVDNQSYASSKGPHRSYTRPLLQSEKDEIKYIIETLGNASLVSIAKTRSIIEKAGNQVEHIHPLLFISYIFSTEKLKAGVHSMRGRSWVWSKFFKGLRGGLEEESQRNNLFPFLKDFAERTHADYKTIYPLAEKRQWKEFFDALLKSIPRAGNTERYDM